MEDRYSQQPCFLLTEVARSPPKHVDGRDAGAGKFPFIPFLYILGNQSAVDLFCGTFSIAILANGGEDPLIPPGGTLAKSLPVMFVSNYRHLCRAEIQLPYT